ELGLYEQQINTEEATLKTQPEGTRLLGERLQDIHYWKSELQRHIDHLLTDTETLLALKTRLEKALDATETPYAITTDNLNCRTRRLGPDLVQDTVEEELMKEVEMIRSVQDLLKRTKAQVVTQIKLNREAKHMLELDWSDKYQAYSFDDHCGRHSNRSPDTKHHPGSAARLTVNDTQQSPHWSAGNICCLCVRLLVEQVLQDTTEDLRVQCSKVDQAFSQRCVELEQAKTQLEMKLTKTLKQIGLQERNILVLQNLAQSRLYHYSLRPNMELCRDEPQLRQIDATLISLSQQLSEARSSPSHLEESRMALEKDINCKTHSLFIDRDKCMTHLLRRQNIYSNTIINIKICNTK
uniref:Tektin n=1 Tax=Anabas testudineus TaxID=64144 RepID=A0A3Q1J445_ANATE